ncbi:Gfo/Idh/MocA family oxidoreductase [Paenibacillus sp. HB172176]|uniref:Gfo/Idh/MocA family protein n=1 Tax=Paenibacillus sp. HB172176 TaxID=2493690 RepID=UPI001439A019|nr:Gfo/Idh/MocA family oxidoreductase [Paenibacillus sp. HB172176]
MKIEISKEGNQASENLILEESRSEEPTSKEANLENLTSEEPLLKVLCLGISGGKLWAERTDARVAGLVDLYGESASAEQKVREGEREVGSGIAKESESSADNIGALALFADVSAALKAVQPDLVYMTIPPWAKTDMTAVRETIEAGYDLYLDKLRPGDWREAHTLLQWAEQSGRQIGIGEAYRFDGRIARVKQLIAEGGLGRLATVVWQCYRTPINAFWMKDFHHVMLEDLSYHHFGVMHYLFGLEQLGRLYAQSVRAEWAPEQPPCVVSIQAGGDEGGSDGGMLLQYYATWAAKGRSGSLLGHFRIEGSEGMIDFTDDGIIYVDQAGAVTELQPLAPSPYELRNGIINEYVCAVRENRMTTLDIRKVHPYLQFIRAALDSVERQQAVTIADSQLGMEGR